MSVHLCGHVCFSKFLYFIPLSGMKGTLDQATKFVNSFCSSVVQSMIPSYHYNYEKFGPIFG